MLFIQVNLQTCIYSDHTYVLNLWFIICKEIQVGNDQEISKHVLIMNAIYDSLLKLPSSEVSVGLNNLTPHGTYIISMLSPVDQNLTEMLLISISLQSYLQVVKS